MRRRRGRQRPGGRAGGRPGPVRAAEGARARMPVRGIRGATTSRANTSDAITEATDELLRELVRQNRLEVEEIAYAYFTTTRDLFAEFPAYAARRLGWVEVPLPNPRAAAKCIRVLLLYNTDQPQSAIRHVYLRGAEAIKADLEAMRG